MASWGSFLAGAVGPLARRALVHLGIGVVSYTAVRAVVEQLGDAVRGSMGGLTGAAYALCAMGGVIDAVSIWLAAVSVAVGVAFVSRLGMMAK